MQKCCKDERVSYSYGLKKILTIAFIFSFPGRIWVHKIGGGDKVQYRMRDVKREGPKDGEPLAERVNAIMKDETRSANLAVVAGGNRKRYIVASENMKAGDIIKTSGKISAMPGRFWNLVTESNTITKRSPRLNP